VAVDLVAAGNDGAAIDGRGRRWRGSPGDATARGEQGDVGPLRAAQVLFEKRSYRAPDVAGLGRVRFAHRELT
jgi:hypothetical protein